MEEEIKNLKAQVAALEEAVKFLLKGAARVQEEISAEWGEETFGDGKHFGIEFRE